MTKKKARISAPNISTANKENTNLVELKTVLTIFREIEDAEAHDRLITQLKLEFYDKLNIEEFSEDFFECMRSILLYKDRSKCEIPLSFCIKFVNTCMLKSSTEIAAAKSGLLLKRLVKYITFKAGNQDPLIRLHCVQAARLLLTELTDDIAVPDVLFEKLQASLLSRFWDVKTYVREEAVKASTRLQDPSDANCPIVVGLMHITKFDSSYKVRLAALEALAITTKTLQCVTERVRDVSDIVRKKSFDLLIKWKILKPLSISARLTIIEAGLTDKSPEVRAACKQLLKAWMIASDNDIVSLLRRLDVDNMERVTEMALYALLESLTDTELISIIDRLQSKMDEQHLILEEHISGEIAFLWRHLVIFVSERPTEFDGQLEKIVPLVSHYDVYLRSLFQKPIDQSVQKNISLDEYAEYCTIIKHLLPIIHYIDIFDTHNRNIIIKLVKWAMSSADIPFNYVEHLMKLLVHLESNNVKICNDTVELINDLLFTDNDNIVNQEEPIDKEIALPVASVIENLPDVDPSVINKDLLRKLRMEIAQIDVQMNELNEAISIGVKDTNFDNFSEIIKELNELKIKRKDLIDTKDKLLGPIETKEVQPVNVEMVDIDEQEVKTESQDIPQWMTKGIENRIIKANIMAITMIKECNLLWSMPPSLRSLFNNVILVSIQHTDVCVREKAILAFGLCCLLDKELAVQYYSVFLKSLEVDHDQIKDVAVKSLVDLYIRFGVEPFQEALLNKWRKLAESNIKEESVLSAVTAEHRAVTEEEQLKCIFELINPIVSLLNEKIELQTTAAVCLSKLLYHHKILSAKILSRLLLMWFNPQYAENIQLKSHLGGFFTNYSLMSTENQDSIAGSFLITMKTLFKAPASDPLSDIDITNVIDFFLRVTDSKYLLDNRVTKTVESNQSATLINMTTSENPCHDKLGKIISEEILQAPLTAEVKYYVSMLVRLRLCSHNTESITNILSMVTVMIRTLKDKRSIQLLNKFHKDLQSKLSTNEEENPQAIVANKTPLARSTLLEININDKFRDSLNIVDEDLAMQESSVKIAVHVQKETILDGDRVESNENHYPTATRRNSRKSRSSKLINETSQKENDDGLFKKPLSTRITRSSSYHLSPRLSSGELLTKNK